MRVQRTALLCLTAATLTFALVDGAFAQKMFSRGPSPNVGRPMGPTGGGSDFHGGGFRGPGWGAVVPGVIMAVPQGYPPDGPFIDDGRPPITASEPSRRERCAAGQRAQARAGRGRDRAFQFSQHATNRRPATPVPADAHRKPGLPVVQHNAVPLAHSGPSLGRDGRACARGRSARRVGATELSFHASRERSEERRRSRAIRTRQAASAAGARSRQGR